MLDLLCDPRRMRRLFSRRETLRAGFLGLGGLALADLLRLRASASPNAITETKDTADLTSQLKAASKQVANQQTFQLQYRPEKGQTIRWKVVHLVTVDTKIRGSEQTAKTRSVSTKAWRVTDVDADSPAGQKNIRAGDVITEVAQQRVNSPDEVTSKIDAERKAGHKVVLLQVSRGGELTFIGVRIP